MAIEEQMPTLMCECTGCGVDLTEGARHPDYPDMCTACGVDRTQALGEAS